MLPGSTTEPEHTESTHNNYGESGLVIVAGALTCRHLNSCPAVGILKHVRLVGHKLYGYILHRNVHVRVFVLDVFI